MEYLQGKHNKCADSTGFVPRYNTGLVAGEHEKVSTKITLSIDVVKIVGKYVIEVDIVKSNFTVRDWLTVLENNMIYRKNLEKLPL